VPVITNTAELFSKWSKENECANHCHSICDFLLLLANNNDLFNKDKKIYLNDSNLVGCLVTLFIGIVLTSYKYKHNTDISITLKAGSDTSSLTFKWMLLLMTYYPEMQHRMRNEIKTNIGIN